MQALHDKAADQNALLAAVKARIQSTVYQQYTVKFSDFIYNICKSESQTLDGRF